MKISTQTPAPPAVCSHLGPSPWAPPFDSALGDQSTRLGTCVVLPRGSIQFFCDEVPQKCKEGAR
jgi:hypothetical protein